MELITSIISQRVDAFGLSDTKVNSLGEDLVAVQIAETDPERIAQIEALLKTQARFEAMIDGNLLFKGSDIRTISKDPASGYGVFEGAGGWEWQLPFTLSQHAATTFSQGVFHKCTPIGFGQGAQAQYDCDKTYFFIDRPDDGVIIIPRDVFESDRLLLLSGNIEENIPIGSNVEDLMANSAVPYIVVDSNLSAQQLTELESFAQSKQKAIVHPSAPQELRSELTLIGFRVQEVQNQKENVPWIWIALGARQAISITPGIANLDPYVDDIRNAKIFSQLSITGGSPTSELATKDLKSLQVLLESGALPIGIESISKETISPFLGKEFFLMSLLIGVVALVLVSIVLFIRYKKPQLTFPIIFIALSEALITVGVSTLLGVRLDLASVTGVIAAIGTGLNDQIVILDELLKGGAAISDSTYANRVKRAFFIIIAAAATIVAALFPIVLLASYGFGKLAGFALTTIIGVFTGILISRPAFSVIAEYIVKLERPKQ